MSQGHNRKFVKSPIDYLYQYTISNVKMEWNAWGHINPPPAGELVNKCSVPLIEAMDRTKVIVADLKPTKVKKEVLFCPVFNHDESQSYVEIPEKMLFFPKLPTIKNDDPIIGYWAPYIRLGKQIEHFSEIGFVDVPKKYPEHEFVFTGNMCGCHLVITDSPAHGDNYFRVWHYQSPADNTIFTPNAWKDRFKNVGQGFPATKIYYWLSDIEYPGLPKNSWYGQYGFGKDRIFGFNFLRYHREKEDWWIYALPLRQVEEKGGVRWEGYDKRPFEKS